MAALSTPNLVVVLNLDNRTIKVTHSIDFDAFDTVTDLRYRHVVALIGDDTNVPGDLPAFEPDEVLAVLLDQVVQASTAPAVNGNGLPTLPVKVEQPFAKSTLNEDVGNPNPDEIRVRVTLTPLLPVPIVRESNLYVEAIT